MAVCLIPSISHQSEHWLNTNRSVKSIKRNNINNLCPALLSSHWTGLCCLRSIVGTLLSARYCRRAFVLRAKDGVPKSLDNNTKKLKQVEDRETSAHNKTGSAHKCSLFCTYFIHIIPN